jgi:GrpB-like predicted nucleotidyltransferase (UPF0157 family)
VEAVGREVLAVVPEAEVLHTGGSSLPGLDTAGDVDVHVRVPAAAFARAREALRARLAVRRSELWQDDFATFAVPGAALPAEVALTARGGEHDRRFTEGWARLRADPALVDELNRLKRETAGDRRRYEAAKGAFFERLTTPRAR